VITRRKFVFTLVAGMLTAASGGAYARVIEPRWLRVGRCQIPAVRKKCSPQTGATPLRVLHLSDLHLSSVVPLSFIAESIALGLAEKPDLIAVTGDFFTGRAYAVTDYAQVLRHLSDAAPTFACLGNHDGGSWSALHGGIPIRAPVVRMLEASGIHCLINDAQVVRVRDRNVQLVGVGDLWSGECEPQLAFARADSQGDALRLVLNHNPDAKEFMKRFAWDVMLSGHTHGGQVRIPLVGAPYAPVHDRRFLRGLYSWNDRWLHVTSGVGNLHGIRFNCRPEVNLLTIA
jgi:predicted MPP superfamily phosphohydrolase